MPKTDVTPMHSQKPSKFILKSNLFASKYFQVKPSIFNKNQILNFNGGYTERERDVKLMDGEC